MVKGAVTNSTGNETGVTVNGMLAVVYNGEFFVNHVPLQDWQNAITANAVDTAGSTASYSMLVNVDSSIPYVTLRANIESGIAPLTTYFSVSASIPNSVLSYAFDYEGDTVADYTGAEFEDISVDYTTEGIYYPTLSVTDDQSNVYSDTIAIVVLNQNDLDVLLRAKWDNMTSSLSLGDTATALDYISPATRTDYEVMFDALSGQLSSIVATQTEMILISIKDRIAKYEVVTLENSVLYSYEVIFIRNENGLWMISGF